MSDEPDSLTLRMMRRMDEKLDRLTDAVTNLQARMTGVEIALGEVNRRLDGVEVRLLRIERRLDLVETP